MCPQDKDLHNIDHLIDHLFRNEYGKVVSFLTLSFGFHFLETAEDIAQDTLAEAYKNWGYNGIPPNPHGWIFKVAKNKALNYVRRENIKQSVFEKLDREEEQEQEEIFLNREIEDSMLRMIFACCHPIIAGESQIALILTTLGGFSRKEVAYALLSDEEAIKKRLYRAKKEIRQSNIVLAVPTGDELSERLKTVCISLYLLFNEGYNASHSDELIRKDFCLEAVRLTRLLAQHFPGETRVSALLSLMLFHAARLKSRIDDKGAIVLFRNQDRGLWNQDLIKAAYFYLSESSRGSTLTSYHLEASIAAQHCYAPTYEKTNWPFIFDLYSRLYEIKPSPVIKLNLAIVSSKIKGVKYGIEQLEALIKSEKKLKNYYLLYATLGQLYVENKEQDLAISNFEQAKSLTASEKEKAFLQNRIDALS